MGTSAVRKKAVKISSSKYARRAVALLVCWCFTAGPAHGAGLDLDNEIAPFAREVSRDHGIDEAQVRRLLADARVLDKVLAAMSKPAEAKPWRDYRPIFLTERRIAGGVDFWAANEALLQRASQRFGVPEHVIVAIIGVETFYGSRAGNIRVLDALATLGFRYPKRATFFRRELSHYVALGESEGLDLRAVKGSYAGAMGIPQFIPSSYREYAVDFDGDQRRDLLGSTADAIGSVAAYLSRHGWKPGAAVAVPARLDAGAAVDTLVGKGIKPHSSVQELRADGVVPVRVVEDAGQAALIELDGDAGKEHWLGFDNFYVITRYNHSQLYAMAVFQLAQSIAARRLAAGG